MAQWRNFAPDSAIMPARPARGPLARALVLYLCLCVGTATAAVTSQFKGAIDGSWENPGNWAPAALPGPTSAPSHKRNFRAAGT